PRMRRSGDNCWQPEPTRHRREALRPAPVPWAGESVQAHFVAGDAGRTTTATTRCGRAAPPRPPVIRKEIAVQTTAPHGHDWPLRNSHVGTLATGTCHKAGRR